MKMLKDSSAKYYQKKKQRKVSIKSSLKVSRLFRRRNKNFPENENEENENTLANDI